MTEKDEADPTTRLLVALVSYMLMLLVLLAGVIFPFSEPGVALWEKICIPIATFLLAGWLGYKLRDDFNYLAYRLEEKFRRKKK